MAYLIGLTHKLIKPNRKRLDNTTDPSSELSNHSYSYDRLNESTDSNTTVVLLPRFDTLYKHNVKAFQMPLRVQIM